MPGRRLPLTAKDKKVLHVFFTKPNNENYLQLLDRWKSTQEISNELHESSDKILQNLKKLHGFGLIFALSILCPNNQIDHYWAINREGVYYVLSTLTRDKLGYFLKSNKDKIKDFSDIGKLVLQNDVQVSYLTRQIKDIVKNCHFHLLENFIETWRRTNVSGQYAMLRFFSPNRKKVLEKYSNKKDKIKTFDFVLERKDLQKLSVN